MTRTRSVVALVAMVVMVALPGTAAAVTGGTPPSREYGFMAAMLVDGSQYCGGSLVAPQYVLTAAHCWDEPEPADVEFVIGGVNLTLEEGERITPASVEVHDMWNARNPPPGVEEASYDVALVRLSRPASAAPIRLADPGTEKSLWMAQPGLAAPRLPARVIGYGLPSFDPPGALFETDVAMVADEDCRRSHDLTGGGFESTTMVCAGEPYGVKDSCFGDSGGPLMVSPTGDLSSGELIQVGVVSWGFLCGVPTQPGVYSRVGDDPLHDWIQRRIGDGSASPAPGTIAGSVTESQTGAALSSVSGYRSKTRTVNVPSGGTALADFALRASKPRGGGGKGKPSRS